MCISNAFTYTLQQALMDVRATAGIREETISAQRLVVEAQKDEIARLKSIIMGLAVVVRFRF